MVFFSPAGARMVMAKTEERKLTTSQRLAQHKPIEVWQTPDGSWTWEVYKKYQKDDDKPYARWFVKAKSPFVPEGELGDEYVEGIKKHAIKKLEKVV
jgi:hypothetical protein